MEHAEHSPSGEVYSAEDALALGQDFARSLLCIDPECPERQLVWKPGNGGRAPHWAHRSGSVPCGGARMTVKHHLMRDAVTSLGLWCFAMPERTIAIPQDPLRTLATRRIDVGVKVEWPQGRCTISVECQHSATDLGREERRVLDHNLAGMPVMLVVSSDCIRDAGGGRARVDFWVREWAKRHGFQQVACVDDDGVLWWCWFEDTANTTTVAVRRFRVVPGTLSVDGNWQLGVTVDATTPERATGAPSLLIAAFAWQHRNPNCKVRWPTDSLVPRRTFQPEHQPAPCYLGTPSGKALVDPDSIVTGGF